VSIDQEMDPFSQAYEALRRLAIESARLRSLVRVGNQIFFNSQSWSPPDKPEVSDADLPELALMVTTLEGRIRQTSSGSMAKLGFDWILSTGDPNVQRAILPVMFAVYAAMTPWVTSITPEANPFMWKDASFIKRVDLVQANVGLADPDRNRGIRGWSSVWACEIEMYFQTSSVILASQQTVQ
jgi:hypothetical protein